MAGKGRFQTACALCSLRDARAVAQGVRVGAVLCVCWAGKGVSGSLPPAHLEPNGLILSCSGIGSTW